MAAGGCAPPVARSFAFERPEYDRVFDAALESVRQAGLQPVVVDRELGVIETGPRTAGSILEPWRTDNDGIGDTMASTVNLQRRRARFEFVPEGFAAPEPRTDQPSLDLPLLAVSIALALTGIAISRWLSARDDAATETLVLP